MSEENENNEVTYIDCNEENDENSSQISENNMDECNVE
jgi:hypothetical protein